MPSNGTKIYLALSIGPVQSFIAEARKTHDLFSGSLIISDAIKELIGYLRDEYAAITIFPAEKGSASYPNRLLVELDISSIKIDMETSPSMGVTLVNYFGKDLRDKLETYILTIGEKLLPKKIATDTAYQELYAIIRQQIKDGIEFYLALTISDSYTEGVERVFTLLGSAKHSRQYDQLEERGRKCNLTGRYNPIIYRARGSQIYHACEDRAIPAYSIKSNYLYQGEGLSALAFIKRRYKYDSSLKFPSTTEIALSHVIQWISIEDDTYLSNQLDGLLKINSQLLYAHLYDDRDIKRILLDSNAEIGLDEVRNSQAVIRRWAGENELNLNTYYAMILFDGDNMGKWWSGAKDLILEDVDLREYHVVLTAALAEFSLEAKNILEAHDGDRGRLIYSGGDDFLGFVNIEYLMPIMIELRVAFDAIINKKISKYAVRNNKITFTAGCMVAHYKEPLRLVLDSLRKVEKSAKSFRSEKDMMAFYILRGAGEPSIFHLPMVTSWAIQSDTTEYVVSDFDNPQNQVNCLQKFQELVDLLVGYYSSGTVEKIIVVLRQLGTDTELLDHYIYKTIRAELSSILQAGSLKDLSFSKEKEMLLSHLNLLLFLIRTSQTIENAIGLFDTCYFLIHQSSKKYSLKELTHA